MKIIQIQTAPESESRYETLYLLTDVGRVFMVTDPGSSRQTYTEIELPPELEAEE